jgi:hypothetical protein
MATFAELEAELEKEEAEEEERQAATEEISRYYDIGMNPSTWSNIPRELLLQGMLALEPSSAGQAGIVSRLGPEGYAVDYDEGADLTTVTDPATGQAGFVNAPGPSVQDLMSFGGLAAAFTPAGRAGRAASTPAQVATRTATAAGLTEASRQTATSLAGSEARDDGIIPGISMPDVAMAAGTQMVPDYLTSRSYMGRYGPASWQTPFYLQKFQQNMQDLGTSGLQALRGQVSEVPQEARDLKVLGQLRHSGPDIQRAYREQNVQAEAAAERILGGGRLSGDRPAGPVARTAAQQHRQNLVDTRQGATGSLYRAAFGDTTPYDTSDMVSNIDNAIEVLAPGTSMHTRLSGIRSQLGGRKPVMDELTGDMSDVPPDPRTLEQLQSVKEDVDDQIATAVRAGENKAAARLQDVKTSVVNFIQDRSEEYRGARELYADLSKPINEFDESLGGTIANLSDDEAYRLGEVVFNRRVSNESRRNLAENLNSVSDGAFEQLTRETMRGRLATIRDIGQAEVENVPQQILQKLFPNETERNMWKESLPDIADELDALYRGLKIQARNRSIGSDTAFNQEARDRYSGLTANTMTDLVKQIMEYVTVVPAAARYTLGALGEETARRRQQGGVAGQLDLSPSQYEQAPRFSQQTYPLVSALLQMGRLEATE